MVNVSKGSSKRGLISTVCFLLNGWSRHELHVCAENVCFFYIQNSIELKIKGAWFVLNQFTWFNIQQRQHFLSYLMVFVFCSYVDLLQSYGCLCRSSEITNTGITHYSYLESFSFTFIVIYSTLFHLWITREDPCSPPFAHVRPMCTKLYYVDVGYLQQDLLFIQLSVNDTRQYITCMYMKTYTLPK